MADSNNVLIVCRDLKSVRRLSRFKPHNKSRYILASDDPRVHEAAKRYPWIDKICWIEKMESFYNVADEVIRLTEIVNEWLKTLTDDKHGFPEELLFFTRHVEGGMTTQRIQDLLLLIRSYHYLFDTYEITSVIVLSQPGLGWEDDVLISMAQSMGCRTQFIGRYRLSVLAKTIVSVLNTFGREPYWLFDLVRARIAGRYESEKMGNYDKEIVFQLCSSAYKHIENITPLMNALKDRGYNPVALTWRALTGARLVRQEGLSAEELEKWRSFSDMWRSISSVFWTWKKAKGKKREFLSHPAFNYRSVPLGSLLWPSVRFFIIAELAQSYRLRQALKKYFKSRVPLAIKLWGSTALRQGYLAWKSLDPKNMPLIFFYAVGAHINWPYEELNSPIDLLFVPGENHKKKIMLKSNSIPSANIEICGQARYDGLDDFKKKYNAERSRIELKIPHCFTMHVFLDTGYIVGGFLSTQEQVTITSLLLKFASEQLSVALIIKPHPGHKVGILESLIDMHALKNVFLVDKNTLPYHALNAADMLITKFSTLGIEAMLFGCPVICCVLDSEKRLNIYEGAADYLYEVDNLEDLLLKLVSDNDFREEWHKRHMQIQKVFLAEYFCKMEESPSVYQAMVLDKYLKERDMLKNSYKYAISSKNINTLG